jgi:hypothetical protein
MSKTSIVPFLLFIFLVNSYGEDFRRFGVEGELSFCNTSIDVPGVYKDAGVSASGGTSLDWGGGVYFYPVEIFRIEAGLHVWNVPFNPSAPGEMTINGVSVSGMLNETGSVGFCALYVDGLFEAKYVFIGMGLDVSVSNWYSSDVSLLNDSGRVIAKALHQKTSILTDEFNNRADLNLKAGIKIPIGHFTVRPTISFAVPTSPLFDTHVTVYDPYFDTTGSVNFTAFTVKYGLWISYSI